MGNHELTPTDATMGVARTAPAAVLTITVACLPVAWVLGMAPFIWLIAALPALISVVRRPTIRSVRYLPLWGFFLLFVLGSGIQLDGPGAAAVWAMRVGWYASGAVFLLYVVNDERPDIVRNVIRALFWLWVITIIGGWLAVLAGDVSWTGAFAKVLPGVVRDSPYVQDLTTPRLTEAQTVGGEVFQRPTAPFTYTNNWGSTLALLTPLGILAGQRRGTGISVRVSLLLASLSVPPLLISLNRGAWASLAVGLLYALIRLARLGRRGAVAVGAVLLLAGVVVAIGSGAVDSLNDQLAVRTGDSTEARLTLYSEALNDALESPIIGFGSPRDSDTLAAAPPVGTQGQLWMLLFSHGFIAAALYVAFFVLSFAANPSRTSDAVWAKACLVVGLLQLPIYGHLPQQLMVMMVVVGLLDHLTREGSEPARSSGSTGAERDELVYR